MLGRLGRQGNDPISSSNIKISCNFKDIDYEYFQPLAKLNFIICITMQGKKSDLKATPNSAEKSKRFSIRLLL